MPEMTSIKVPVGTRDRLAAAAQARGTTVRALLDEYSRRVLDEELMRRAGAEMAALRDGNPREWDVYLAEGSAWEQGTVERLAT
ncbi:MAG: hypothetical protein ACT4QG_00660 [Sporichthyaceae bacterium]